MAQARCSEATRRARSERARRNAALLVAAQNPLAVAAEANPSGSLSRSWKRIFLIALGQSSDIEAACKAARTTVERAFSVRREDPQFAVAWRRALLEGYENLELETLYYLRSGHAPHGEAKFDVANAIRLIRGQAEVASRDRAVRDEDDDQAVLDSIDRKLDRMRERAAANTALLDEAADE